MRPTALTERFGLAAPLVLAPMAGGPSTPALVAAVCNAGGLGSFGAAYLSPAAVRDVIREIRKRTSKPFAINLQIDDGVAATREQLDASRAVLSRYGPVPETLPAHGPWRAAFEVIREERAPIFSFCYGVPPPEVIDACRSAGLVTIGTATTVAEAVLLERGGVEFICAQGAEAGGHRGTFDRDAEPALVGTMALVPQIADAVRAPVIAAGGIMDGRGIRAALELGACGASLGTAFLLCPEAGTSTPYRSALRQARDDSTVITRAFSGRAARGLANRFTRELSGATLAPYPAQNSLTREIRAAAAKAGDSSLLSLWAGQAAALARELPAAELVARLIEEAWPS